MKIKLSKLKRDHVNVLVRRVSDYHQYINFMMLSEKKQVHFIHFSIISELQFKILKKAMDPQLNQRSKMSFDLHTAFILHDALLYKEEDHDYFLSLQQSLIYEINQQLPSCSDSSINSTYSEI